MLDFWTQLSFEFNESRTESWNVPGLDIFSNHKAKLRLLVAIDKVAAGTQLIKSETTRPEDDEHDSRIQCALI